MCAACGENDAVRWSSPRSAASAEDDAPTFTRDIAPILFQNCSVCHRPGEAAPFSLLTFDDAKKRAKQIAIVTGSRYMPPWLPEAQPAAPFLGDRTLSSDEIDTLARWAEAGAPEGDPKDLPPTPRWTAGWQLGEPDLVATMPRAFDVPLEGRDIYRNFLIPAPLAPGSKTRYVRAVEWRVDNRVVLHHAALFVDRSGASRELEATDPAPGFPGMGPGNALVPDGQFVGWAPGKVTRAGEEGIAWTLDDQTDIVLQLHLRPSGKPESIRVSLGLHFADAPPTRSVVSIRLMSNTIDIPAGQRDYRVVDRYVVPVDLSVHGIYPHAHYLARDMRGTATLPNGSTRTLFHIPSWDFNWQDEYAYVEPIALPQGSEIVMEYVYDNSADNVLNPNSPPKRVVFGEQSDDEMAELLLQVEPSTDDLPLLWRDFAWKTHRDQVARFERLALEEPDAPRWHGQLGNFALRDGRFDEAIRRFQRVAEIRAGKAKPLANLGHAYLLSGDARSAADTLRRALAIDARLVAARVELGRALTLLEDYDEASAELSRALAELPGMHETYDALAELSLATGDDGAASGHYAAALEANPDDVHALVGLGRLRAEGADRRGAIELFRRALAVYPDESAAHFELGRALDAEGLRDDAERHLAIAVQLAPRNAEYAREFERVRTLPR